MRASVRWALVAGFGSLAAAVIVGFAALNWGNGQKSQASSGFEGDYAFMSTDIVLDTPFASVTELVFSGGRLTISSDGRVSWSLRMHSKRDASRTGTLSCDGTFSSAKRRVTPSPRYGYSGFASDLANHEIQRSIYEHYCAGVGLYRPDNRPLEVALDGTELRLEGRGGAIVWRRE